MIQAITVQMSRTNYSNFDMTFDTSLSTTFGTNDRTNYDTIIAPIITPLVPILEPTLVPFSGVSAKCIICQVRQLEPFARNN